jgi:hypothetical protein
MADGQVTVHSAQINPRWTPKRTRWFICSNGTDKPVLAAHTAEITGYDANKLRQYKSISERFEMLLRSNKLSWNHHYEVASTIGWCSTG